MAFEVPASPLPAIDAMLTMTPLRARDHLARHALQAEERPLAVDPHDAVPVGLGEIHDVGPAGDAGIVHEDVDPPEVLHHPAGHPVDRAEIADVGVEREALAAERGDRRRRLRRRRGIDVDGGDDGAGLGRARAPSPGRSRVPRR